MSHDTVATSHNGFTNLYHLPHSVYLVTLPIAESASRIRLMNVVLALWLAVRSMHDRSWRRSSGLLLHPGSCVELFSCIPQIIDVGRLRPRLFGSRPDNNTSSILLGRVPYPHSRASHNFEASNTSDQASAL